MAYPGGPGEIDWQKARKALSLAMTQAEQDGFDHVLVPFFLDADWADPFVVNRYAGRLLAEVAREHRLEVRVFTKTDAHHKALISGLSGFTDPLPGSEPAPAPKTEKEPEAEPGAERVEGTDAEPEDRAEVSAAEEVRPSPARRTANSKGGERSRSRRNRG